MSFLNPIPQAPKDPQKQLQWLVDQAEISNLLSSFARTMDSHDWEGYEQLFTEDCIMLLPPNITVNGGAAVAQGGKKGMSKFFLTWHMTGNPGIEIDGDSARSRSYSMGVHRFTEEDPNYHSTGAGWYDCEYRRTANGWRFSKIALNIVWHAGEGARPTL